MALDTRIQVDMPPHCVKVPQNGHIYIQYVIRAYRNEKGQPTNQRISIGKLDPQTGKLIPNRNYYEVFQKEKPEKAPEFVKNCGSFLAFRKVAEDIGLSGCLRDVFGETADDILSVAHYMMCEGNVMYYFPDWADENVSFRKEPFSDREISRMFSSLCERDRMVFLNNWMKKNRSGEFIAYDVTSVSSYGEKMESLEWGYNRDKEKLRQINLGMFYGEQSKMPLYYSIYPGSIPDKSHLPYMMTEARKISQKMNFVMDRGFYSADNLRLLTENGFRFVMALPEGLQYAQKLIEERRNEIVNKSECYLGIGKPYGKAYEVTELGFRMKVHLYYDPVKASAEGEAFQEALCKWENELKEMKEPPDRKMHYDRYFFINRSKDGKMGFRRNTVAIDRHLNTCGFFLIAETDFRKTSGEILEIYRQRNVIEKSFDDLKNDLDMRRLFVQSDDAVRGKAFCAFVSLIVLSKIRATLAAYMEEHKMTFRRVLLEWNKLKTSARLSQKTIPPFLIPPSKTARELLSLLGVSL